MPTLYYAPGACSLAPHIALEWIGAPYEAVKVKIGSKELLAVNPADAVPNFREDDGRSFAPNRDTADKSEAARQALVSEGHGLAAKHIGVLDRDLDARGYIMNGGRSVIEAFAFPMIRWWAKLVPGGRQELSRVQALLERLAAHTALQNVLGHEAAA